MPLEIRRPDGTVERFEMGPEDSTMPLRTPCVTLVSKRSGLALPGVGILEYGERFLITEGEARYLIAMGVAERAPAQVETKVIEPEEKIEKIPHLRGKKVRRRR